MPIRNLALQNISIEVYNCCYVCSTTFHISYSKSSSDVPIGQPRCPSDFNWWHCYPGLDKHPPLAVGRSRHRTALLPFLEEVGWVDPWCTRNSQQKHFSCFSKTHVCLSPELTYVSCTQSVVPLIEEIQYGVRGISDHSLVFVHLYLPLHYCKRHGS